MCGRRRLFDDERKRLSRKLINYFICLMIQTIRGERLFHCLDRAICQFNRMEDS